MIGLVVRANSFMDGQTVGAIQDSEGADIVLLHQGVGNSPDARSRGDIVVRGGDTLVLFAHHDRITEILGRNESGGRWRISRDLLAAGEARQDGDRLRHLDAFAE